MYDRMEETETLLIDAGTGKRAVVQPGFARGTAQMKTLFASGCALRAYKPELISRIMQFLREAGMIDGTYETCCKSGPAIEEETLLIDCCPGCSHMFGTFPDTQAVSLWKVLLDTDFPFPDYSGRKMTIHDACHARNRNSSEMQDSARALCRRMNIDLVEPELTRDETPCCGGSAKDCETRVEMANRRAGSLPLDEVVVYCTGCVRSFSVTPARPHHLLDLLFNEPTEGLTIRR